MVSAINFAVRTSAGGTQLGSVGGEGQSNLIAVQPGQSISLNLSPGSVVAYKQQGSDLIVQLMDGRSVVLSNYFAGANTAPSKLYLSSNDEIVEVRVADGVDGVLFADYGPTQAMEKWSPLDDLRFSQSDVLDDALLASNEPAGMAGLVPGLLAGGGTAAGLGGLGTAAALAGGAALLGSGSGGDTDGGSTGGGSTGGGGTGGGSTGGGSTGGGGMQRRRAAAAQAAAGTGGGGTGGGGTGGGGTTHTPPTVDTGTQPVLTTNTSNPSIVVTGTGHPGDTVAVTVGTNTERTTIGSNGTWSVTYTGTSLPPDGTYVPSVIVTNTVTGGQTTLTGSTYIIDMTPAAFSVLDGTTSNGDIHNIASYVSSGGKTIISGAGEVGSTVTVVANGHSQSAVVGQDGTWSVNFTQTQIPGGDYHLVPIQVFSTDVNLNVSAALNTSIAIDTVANAISVTSLAGDNWVNKAESDNGFTLSGVSVGGQSLTITLSSGATQTITVPANGQWTASFGGGTVTQNGAASVTLTSTDAAGNPNSVTHNFNVDTLATAAINAGHAFGTSINAAEAATGVDITGTSDRFSTVVVTFEGQTRTVTADGSGNWTANFNLSHLVGQGAVDGTSTITVTATDQYQNVATTQQSVTIDTRAPDDPLFLQDVGTQGTMSGVITAAAAGDYTYHAVGATGAAQQLIVSPSSTWSHTREDGTSVASETVNFASNVPNGSYLVIRDVDAAGNESSTLHLRSTTEVTVELDRAGLQGFDFGTINLLSADANVTLDRATVAALTGADKQMTITGNADDTVTLVGATDQNTTVNSNGETYRLYTLGAGVSVLVDDDMQIIPAP
ncbi:MAG: Ig-like domain-containing protein [Cypionkella sp.]|nr:Ig-like domain-containing protein [Cypionkella sp.]